MTACRVTAPDITAGGRCRPRGGGDARHAMTATPPMMKFFRSVLVIALFVFGIASLPSSSAGVADGPNSPPLSMTRRPPAFVCVPAPGSRLCSRPPALPAAPARSNNCLSHHHPSERSHPPMKHVAHHHRGDHPLGHCFTTGLASTLAPVQVGEQVIEDDVPLPPPRRRQRVSSTSSSPRSPTVVNVLRGDDDVADNVGLTDGGTADKKTEEEEDRRWKSWLDRLVSYRRRYCPDGGCLTQIDHPFEFDPALRIWVNFQRDEFRRMRMARGNRGRGSSMTPERARMLHDVGFDFRLHPDDDDGDGDDFFGGVVVATSGGGTHPSAYAGGAGKKIGTAKTGRGKKSRSRRDASWEERYDELRLYREEHGNCDVPRSVPTLGPWVYRQRDLYHMQNGDSATNATSTSTSLTPHRVALLNELGFDWDRPSNTRVSFEERLSQLAEFRARHGHVDVPQNHPTLGSFVNGQRVQYRRYLRNDSSTMTPERIAALEDLGFRWSVASNPDEAWVDRLTELRQFRKEHGHCDVPSNLPENPGLGRWAKRQRAQYKLLQRGRPSTLTKMSGRGGTRLSDLERLGFAWGNFSVRWIDRYRQLCKFHEVHGHCDVPTDFDGDDDGGLVRWVHAQRKARTRGTLSAKKVRQLEELGFLWSGEKRRDAWNDRYDELRRYMEDQRKRWADGDDRGEERTIAELLPRTGTTPLGRWVSTQRHQYARLRRGERSSMTEERVRMLDDIGFVWNVNSAASGAGGSSHPVIGE